MLQFILGWVIGSACTWWFLWLTRRPVTPKEIPKVPGIPDLQIENASIAPLKVPKK
jgi:hypothetical protein